MKSVLLLALLSLAFTLPHSAEAKSKKKSYNKAKKECLAKDPSLAGKDLQYCIKEVQGSKK